jgi:micrococcal nuclease
MVITIILFSYAYNKTFTLAKKEVANVTKVIDGDTIEVNQEGTAYKVRLLDINTPEKKQPYHQDAVNFLKAKIEGREVILERGKEDKDKYSRLLRYVFYDEELVNAKILQEGLANFYSYQNTQYTSRLKKAEEQAREQEKGIWEKSQHACSSCISLEEVENGEGKEDCQAGNEWVTFLNSCSQVCILDRWTIKDDASHIYTFKEIILRENQKLILYNGQGQVNLTTEQVILFFQNKDRCASIWNDEQDSLFLRDAEGKLVIYHHYE